MGIRFGVHAGLQNTSTDELRSLWGRIEGWGYDWISIWDHFYAANLTGDPVCLEAVSTHAALALDTERVTCGSLVYSIGYRHPAVLANSIATIDNLSGGRAVLGMGAGWSEPEYRAYGIPFPSAGVRLRQLDEGIQCVKALLNEDSVDFEGEFFTLTDAKCEPKPTRQPFPVWIGGGGEKVTLRIAAQHADGWNVPFVSVDDFARKVQVLEGHCADVGRDPASIEKAVNVGMAFSQEQAEAQFGAILPAVQPSLLSGSVQEMTDKVGGYIEAGAEWLILAARAPFDVEGIERFASDVVPQFR